MALEIVASEFTRRAEFELIPAFNKCLLEVSPGIPAIYALSQAGALDSAVLHVLERMVSDGPESGGYQIDLVSLCTLALETAIALRESVNVVV